MSPEQLVETTLSALRKGIERWPGERLCVVARGCCEAHVRIEVGRYADAGELLRDATKHIKAAYTPLYIEIGSERAVTAISPERLLCNTPGGTA